MGIMGLVIYGSERLPRQLAMQCIAIATVRVGASLTMLERTISKGHSAVSVRLSVTLVIHA